MRSHIRRLLESAGFSPRQLFAALQGAWLEPTPGSIWQENTGITPTTTGGQTIGLMLDQSQGAVLGPELVTNGTFDADLTGWTVGSDPLQVVPTWSSGRVSLTRGTGGASGFSQALGLVTGRTYRVSFELISGNVSCGGGIPGFTTVSTVGVNTRLITANGSNIQFWPTNFSSTAVIDNISVRQVLGNHAYQATAANRPVLGRRYNLLTYSEDFSNGAWTKQAGVTTPSADTITVTTGGTGAFQIWSKPAATYSVAIEAKYIDVDQIVLGIVNVSDALFYKFSDNSVTGPSAGNAIVTSLADGWKRITFTYAIAAAGFGLIVKLVSAGSVKARYADFRLTSDVGKDPSYQRITTATDYDYGQYPAAVFDTNDFLSLSLPAINVRRNLLTYSEQFDNAVWSKTNITPVYAGATATGTAVYALYETTDNAYHAASQGIGSVSSTERSSTVWIKPNGRNFAAVGRNLLGGVDICIFDLTGNGSVTSTSGSVVGSIATASDGYYRCTVTYTSTSPRVQVGPALNGTTPSYAGDPTKGVLVAGTQLELGSVATDYQKITDWTSEAYSSNGSVYFSTPVGMSQLNNQSMGTTYQLPALSSDIYSWIVVPQRLSAVQESQLQRYMLQKSGLAAPDYFEQVDYGPELVTTTSITGVAIGGPAFTNYDLGAARIVGRSYLISFTVSGYSGSGNVGVAGGAGTSWVTNPAVVTADGSYSYLLTALQTSNIALYTRSTNTCNFSNISVRELKDGMTGQLTDDAGDLIFTAQ